MDARAAPAGLATGEPAPADPIFTMMVEATADPVGAALRLSDAERTIARAFDFAQRARAADAAGDVAASKAALLSAWACLGNYIECEARSRAGRAA